MLKEIPNTCGFLASNTGEIYDPAGNLRKQYKNGDGYSTATVLTETGWVTFGVHRLVALAFIEPPEDPMQLTVNHKDSDKSNNDESNLEWITVKLNNIHHALSKPPTRPMILVWKSNEAESILTESLDTAGHIAGCSAEDVWQAIVTGNACNGYSFKHQRSHDPVPAHLRKTTIPKRDRLGMIPESPTKLRDIHTGEVTIYPTMTAAATAHGVLTGHLSAVARTPRLSLFRGRYQVAYADREFRHYDYETLLNASRWGIGRPVAVIGVKRGEITHYPSASEFIAVNELSKKAITVRLKRDGDLGSVSEYGSFRFAYADLDLIKLPSEESSL